MGEKRTRVADIDYYILHCDVKQDKGEEGGKEKRNGWTEGRFVVHIDADKKMESECLISDCCNK